MGATVEDAQHAVAAETGDEMVDERDRPAVGLVASVETFLAGGQGFAAQHRQADEVEAEAGIGGIVEKMHLLGEEPHEGGVVAGGLAGLHPDAPDDTVGAEDAGLEQPSALAALLQRRQGGAEDETESSEEVLAARHRFGEAAFHHAGRHRPAGGEAGVFAAGQAAEPRRQ